MIRAYYRFSSENQTGGCSIEMQRGEIKRYVQSRSELKGQRVIEYADEARTGTTTNKRDALARLRQEVQKGDLVLFYKLDRFARSLDDTARMFKEFKENGVTVASTTEGEDDTTLKILAVLGEKYSNMSGERCKGALETIVAAGYAANGACYGYKLESDGERKRLVPVPEQAKVVRRIFAMRADGRSHREIVATLNRERIPSPRPKEGEDTLWGVGCVYQLLKNERFLGTESTGRRLFKKGYGLQGFRPRNEWTIFENAHEPIIDQNLWKRVRARDSQPSKRGGTPGSPVRRTAYLLSGVARCPDCGKSLVIHRRRCVYYGHDGRNNATRLACHNRYLIKKDELEERIHNWIFNQVLTDAWVEELVASFRGHVNRARGNGDDTLPKLVKEHDALCRKVERAIERKMEAPDDELAVCERKLTELKAERDQLAGQIEKARLNGGRAPLPLSGLESKLRKRLQELAFDARNQNVMRAREVLSLLVERLSIDRDLNAELVLRPSFILGEHAVHIPTGI